MSAPKLAAIFGIAAIGCILLTTVLGVSNFSAWLLNAALSFFVVAIVIFGSYVILGIIGDAGTV